MCIRDREIVDAETMQPLAENRKPALMAAAVYFGDVRLIANIELYYGEDFLILRP